MVQRNEHSRSSQQWHDEIGSALKRCDWFIVELSPDAVDSTWVKRELHYALRQERYENRVIPVLYKDCDIDNLSWVLGGMQIVRAETDRIAAYVELLRIWGIGLRTPPAS